jgi:hypothetical protein
MADFFARDIVYADGIAIVRIGGFTNQRNEFSGMCYSIVVADSDNLCMQDLSERVSFGSKNLSPV